VNCAGGYVLEGATLEIDTGACNYLSLTQGLPMDLTAGDTLRVRAWWQRLASDVPAVGHISVVVGDTVIWQEDVAIPGSADARDVEIAAPRAFASGEPVTLHLHNHGYNTWQFADLSVR